MSRVKMNAKHEYEFIANFKVLQNVFKAKKIDKVRAPDDVPCQPSSSSCAAHTHREAREMQNAVRTPSPSFTIATS